jgi:hypothetical protein
MKKGTNLKSWLTIPALLLLIVEIALAGQIIYVDADSPSTWAYTGTSWQTAYIHLQDALAEANSGDEIRVAQGTYTPDIMNGIIPPDPYAIFQLKNGVTIKGGYAGFGEPDPDARDVETYETILSGEQMFYHVVTGSGTDATAVLDGFIIKGANNNRYGLAPPMGGGMLNLEGSPTVLNCTFQENIALNHAGEGRGGGVYNLNSQAKFTNCKFIGNQAGAGGGVHNGNWQSDLVPCFINCIFYGNTATGGGGVRNYNSQAKFINCKFIGNQASVGGGVYNINLQSDLVPCFINCIFYGNTTTGGGAVFNFECDPIILNSILWNNEPDEISDYESMPVVTYCDVQGGWEGLGNIDIDPCFVDPCSGDFHLKSQGWQWNQNRQVWTWDDVTSRCIDAGNPGCPLGDELTTVPPDPTNEYGMNVRINMGAYGGTAEASMPPYDWALLADLTNDGIVNLEDFTGQVADWLEIVEESSGDLDRDGIVGINDFVRLAEDWLKQTVWFADGM